MAEFGQFSPEARRLLLRAAKWCRNAFSQSQDPDQLNACAGAFQSSTSAEARQRLLCVMLGGSVEEREVCRQLFDGATPSEGARAVRSRFTPSAVDAAERVIASRVTINGDEFSAQDLLSAIDGLGRPAAAPAVVAAKARAPAPAPAAPAPPPTDVAAAIRSGLEGPGLNILDINTFPLAVQECLRDAPEEIRGDLIGVTAEIEERLAGASDRQKLEELCHQVDDTVATVRLGNGIKGDFGNFGGCLRCPQETDSLIRAIVPEGQT